MCLRKACEIVGVKLDPDKWQMGQEIAVLGALFNVSLVRENTLWVKPKPARIRNLSAEIDDVVKQNCLSNSRAARIIGKFGFVTDQLYGKVGRAAVTALRQRQYSQKGDSSLTEDLRISLGLVKAFLQCCPPRKVKMTKVSEHPVILYTDASDVPGRPGGQFVVGAVLFHPGLPHRAEYTSLVVPTSVVSDWIPKQTQIGQLEAFAAPVALDTWAHLLQGREVILLIDNTSAMHSLIKGYSPKLDTVKLVGDFWLRAARLGLDVFIDRVESKSNIADGPSRLDISLVESLGYRFVPPTTTLLSAAPCRDPFLWFQTGVGA
jgi:hypothetical protein